MRIITANTNGIRAAARKGFFEWLATQDADVVCIQETKAQRDQLDDPQFHPEGYSVMYSDAEKKGYSGTAMYCKTPPKQFVTALGWDPADSEGRYIRADYDNISVISLYMPSGSSSDEAQAKKDDFLERIYPHFVELKEQGRELIICADWNICHKEIDLKNWKPNQKNSGFLPHERAWLDKLYDEAGFVDAFREINQEAVYTWWSNRGQAYANNVGWRLDYQVITPGLVDSIRDAWVYNDERFSDHAPFIMDYDGSL
ncbi:MULTISPECIES: exodeoxyribonuclease III [Spongiibacter]|uniref:exodeoxyribonuclease III n=1 Tax=Spongiibacter TaxID=630749 RepID=UPI001B0AB32E|nr:MULTISPECIES: exodeoxyribonuclease III [Spongiibacter]MBO6752436.1 exodeoxyribonuclease III [Spongiibacter sp.]|tara:strand:- start:20134 stop:20904 length:771 start_codon:yes stop_codon:yes gene_type:complete